MTTKLRIKIVRKGIPTPRSVAFLQLWPTVGWIKMPLGKEVGLGPGHIVLDGDPVGTQQPLPTFRPMSFVAKRSPISATAELLSRYCVFSMFYSILPIQLFTATFQ